MRLLLQRTYPWPWRIPARPSLLRAETARDDTPVGSIQEKGPSGAAPTSPPPWSLSPIPGPAEPLLFASEDRRPSVAGSPVTPGSGDSSAVARLLALSGFIGIVAMLFFAGGFVRNLSTDASASVAPPAALQRAEVKAAPALRMGPVTTGIAPVDDALRGFLAGDADQAASKLVFENVPCGAVPWGGVPALPCAAEEATGSTHEVFLAGCEPAWISRQAARAELGTLLAQRPGLLSVAKANGAYHAVLSWPDATDHTLMVTISATGVTSYASGCGPATAVAAR